MENKIHIPNHQPDHQWTKGVELCWIGASEKNWQLSPAKTTGSLAAEKGMSSPIPRAMPGIAAATHTLKQGWDAHLIASWFYM